MVHLSPRFVLLSALITSTIAQTVPQLQHRREVPLPEGFKAVGSAALDEKITFRIALSQKDFPGLEGALYSASKPQSSQYGKYLSKEQTARYTAPSDEATAAVKSWLSSNGLVSTALTPSSDWISVEATVAQANQLLQAEYSTFEREGTDGAVTRTLSYTLPSEIKQHVVAIHPTISFPSSQLRSQDLSSAGPQDAGEEDERAPNEGEVASRQSEEPIPASCIPLPNSIGFERYAKPRSLPCRFDRYKVPRAPLEQQAAGGDIWVSGFNNAFASKNGTRRNNDYWRPDIVGRDMFELVTITGGLNNQLRTNAGSTATLVSVMNTAPNTRVTYMSVGTDNAGADDPMVWYLDQAAYLLSMENPPDILVQSAYRWVLPESSVDADLAHVLCHAYAQLAARGVTILVNVGAWGVGSGSECSRFDAPFPSSCPYVTSVGATALDILFQQREVPSLTNSGGFSDLFPRPPYQDDAASAYLDTIPDGMYEGMYNASGRAIPDISLDESEVLINQSGSNGSGVVGNQSTFLAGIIALLNEELVNAGKPKLGFLNPLLYENPGMFHDFTTGSNPGCGTVGFNATTGWDPLSGLGAPRYDRLRSAVGL